MQGALYYGHPLTISFAKSYMFGGLLHIDKQVAGDDGKSFTCDICNLSFASVPMRTNHYLSSIHDTALKMKAMKEGQEPNNNNSNNSTKRSRNRNRRRSRSRGRDDSRSRSRSRSRSESRERSRRRRRSRS